jgi:hypothetical protein
MKKIAILTLVILINSSISFSIGFPHGYSKKKKLEHIENNKREESRNLKKVISYTSLVIYSVTKIDLNNFLKRN